MKYVLCTTIVGQLLSFDLGNQQAPGPGINRCVWAALRCGWAAPDTSCLGKWAVRGKKKEGEREQAGTTFVQLPAIKTCH